MVQSKRVQAIHSLSFDVQRIQRERQLLGLDSSTNLKIRYNNNNNNHEIIEQEKRGSAGNSPQAQISSCNNPLCIRCVRYGYLQKNAKSKLSWILWDFKTRFPSKFSSLNQRIPNSIQQQHGSSDNGSNNSKNSNSNSPLLLQNPTVLMVSDLPSKEIVTDWHQNTYEYLSQRSTRRIVFDVLRSLCLYGDYDGWGDNDWTENDSPQGQVWKVFHILNQGSWNPILLDEDEDDDDENKNDNNNSISCQKKKLLLDLVRNIPGLLDNCIFGNVFISKIYHCGPTNILTYNGHADETQMMKGRTTDFVGGGVHENEPDLDPEQARIVLIIDLWHPSLQDMEKTLLQQLYPPFTSSDSKKIS
ncbi:hypothetical protein FRACYDRAFT_238793 [Fragilariopsis cylindrus CCMP1102]|uniref:Uncharacterized protein n=1 Tax=Fragilariopsis cylindrus CCMP1102 TaxID=635003 RepID=A0A1E7FDI2_9STRA|nr:hypothetical protein FRACYDRAFT_238793 [Fragilariopsis cylindrus CCMP1102]|eukprot:OEU16204.1 hypothetical protein FRACYDRAFT_238793 [Fragilariopsis cylindrus CCMP1102]